MTGTADWLHGGEDEPAADPIAVIGLACRFPGAMSAGAFWRNLADGIESAVLDEAEFFDSEFFGFSVREAGRLDPQQRMFLELAYTALEDGAYDSFRHEGDIGVFAGAAGVGRSDSVCALTSGRLRLRGPSVAVHTAYSTSLVALHLAVLALRNGECGMALSGGVDIVPPGDGVRASVPGRGYSPAGHCRAFDARADGTVPGSGGAVVLLKRLRDALADGDHIRAVLLGDAISHDGQAAVIARALAAADVDPRTIGYVEADGSGTLLGDYAEVGALSSVFRQYSGDAGWCALGAVTTNIGHLGGAAGVAGLVKTVLALEQGFIPATLNYETANPKIDFGGNPFYVNTALARWEPDGVPRRASVSSFGAAGTNAHAILEEPPRQAYPRPGDDRPSHLLLLSARTPTALDAAARRLSEHLAGLPDGGLPDAQDARTALADVAYTLRVGRPVYQHRLAVTATSPAEAATALLTAARVIIGTASAEPPEIILTFPGEGASAGMVTQLYQTEPVVRETIDECAEAIRDHVGADIREVLLHADDEDRLRQGAIAQSALFSFEYALALFWRDLGVVPVGMIGHGVGEYVAATLAEACTLSDVLAALCADSVQRLRFRSGVAGDWIPGSAAAGPAYWARQGRETVRLPDYLAAVRRAADPLLLECGPGERLSALAPSHLGGGSVAALPSLLRRDDSESDLDALYSAVGRLWVSGAKLDLASFGSRGRRVPLPTYPWERQYVPTAPGGETGDPDDDPARLAGPRTVDEWFAMPAWRQLPVAVQGPGHRCLLFADEAAGPLADALYEAGNEVIRVRSGPDFHRDGAAYRLRPTAREDYEALFADLAKEDGLPSHIIHAWATDGAPAADAGATWQAQDRGLFSLLHLVQALAAGRQRGDLQLDVITAGTQDVLGGDGSRPEHATVAGVTKVARLELPWLRTRHIDLDPAAGLAMTARPQTVAQIAAELRAGPTGDLIALRAGRRWERVYEQVTVTADGSGLPHGPGLRDQGVYLITDGLNGIGIRLAEELARSRRARLVVISRGGLPPSAERDGPASQAMPAIRRLEDAGAEVLVLAADMTDAAAMRRVREQVLARFGTINGIVHAAGVPGESGGTVGGRAAAEATMSAKIAGTLAIQDAFGEADLDFVLLCSSVTALTGGYGQVGRCAADSFLDAYARRGLGWRAPVVSVNWGSGLEDGWLEDGKQAPGARGGLSAGISAADGAAAFARLVSVDLGAQVAITPVPVSDIAPDTARQAAACDEAAVGDYVMPRDELETAIARVWEQALGVERISVTDDFFDLGGNSLVAARMISRVRDQTGVRLPARSFFADPTVAGVAATIAELREASDK